MGRSIHCQEGVCGLGTGDCPVGAASLPFPAAFLAEILQGAPDCASQCGKSPVVSGEGGTEEAKSPGLVLRINPQPHGSGESNQHFLSCLRNV